MARCLAWLPVVLLIMVLVVAGPQVAQSATIVRSDADAILFLLPDSINLSEPRVTVWLDAAAEEGLHLKPVTDTQFLQMGSQALQYLGLIMPDQVHQTAGDDLVSALQNYVSGGGKLMLVYDAGVLTTSGFYAVPASRFSSLVGVNYALYDQLRDQTIGFGAVKALQSTWRSLGVPPGKSMLYPTESATADPVQGLTSYYYGFLNYPSFVTQGAYSGKAFVTSPNFGLVVGSNIFGKGQVLFVNTPLGYLKGYGTDGLLLHGFLRYFGTKMLGVPYLSPLPNGTSGLVLNIHTDYGGALADIKSLDGVKFWDSGPYSIDFTAGPDTVTWNDHQGLDVPGNQTTQSWMKYFVGKGHEVGSHGGWIHDFYGLNATEENQNTLIPESGNLYSFQDLLAINKSAIESVLGPRKVREYAAPEGNTPKWSVDWLEQNGVVAYYWVGDTGMAPTRGYREGQLFTKSIWAHPITPYGTSATFEEFSANNIPTSEASKWLTSLVDFAVKYRTSRLIYFHEGGITGSDSGISYLNSVQALLSRGKKYGSKFSLYTMAKLSDFLSDRERVSWQTVLLSDGSLQITGTATSTLESLAGMTWVLPKSQYAKPVGIMGVTVVDDGKAKEWLVISTGGTSAQFSVMPVAPNFALPAAVAN